MSDKKDKPTDKRDELTEEEEKALQEIVRANREIIAQMERSAAPVFGHTLTYEGNTWPPVKRAYWPTKF